MTTRSLTGCDTTAEQAFLSPPRVARRLGVSHSKILAWIASSELRAADFATVRGQRPRWRVAETDLTAFLARRTTSPPPEQRRRKLTKQEVIQCSAWREPQCDSTKRPKY